MKWPRWSFKEFVGTVNTAGLSSVVTTFLWMATGLWTIFVQHWATVGASNADVSLKRVGALLALLPFHAAWCGYLLARSGVNLATTAVKRNTDLDFMQKKSEIAVAKAEVAKATNGSPKPVAESEVQPEWADVPGRGIL